MKFVKFVPDLSLYQKKSEKGEPSFKEVQRQRALSPRNRFTERSLAQIQRPGDCIRLANLVAAEAGGVGQLAGLETSGLRGAAGERPGAVAVAVGWASSGCGNGHTGGHTGGLAVVLIIAVVVIVVGVIPVVVRVMLVGAAVLEAGVILVVTSAGGRSGSRRSRRSSLQLSCVSTEDPLRHERNQIHTTVTVAVTVTVAGLQLSPLPELPEPAEGVTEIRVAVEVEVPKIVVTSSPAAGEEVYDPEVSPSVAI